MASIWIENSPNLHFMPLNKDISTDVLIIGGGMAGLLCAYMLKNAGVDCVLLEAKELCGGVTKNTTAKITLQHGLIYDKLIKRFGVDTARLYAEAQSLACDIYRRMCKGLDCDYEAKDSYVYSTTDSAKIEKELAALKRIGVRADYCEDPNLPFKVAGAVRIENQAQFHPLRFALGIAKGLHIYENTRVLKLDSGKAVTERGTVKYKKAIVATHFPFINKQGCYFLKLYQHRSYVLALEDAADVGGMYVDEDKKGLSFRNSHGLLLLGGGAHRTGKQGGGWRELEAFAKRSYPNARVVCKWATQDCMSLDGVPYMGRYSRSSPDVYVATGFNKWGMTSSMVSSMILADLVRGRKNKYAAVFSPSRTVLRPQLAANVLESAVGLLTPTVPRCTHLGCALKYNKEEHTWDCPCHGSRFEKSGDIIDNPANKRL